LVERGATPAHATTCVAERILNPERIVRVVLVRQPDFVADAPDGRRPRHPPAVVVLPAVSARRRRDGHDLTPVLDRRRPHGKPPSQMGPIQRHVVLTPRSSTILRPTHRTVFGLPRSTLRT